MNQITIKITNPDSVKMRLWRYTCFDSKPLFRGFDRLSLLGKFQKSTHESVVKTDLYFDFCKSWWNFWLRTQNHNIKPGATGGSELYVAFFNSEPKVSPTFAKAEIRIHFYNAFVRGSADSHMFLEIEIFFTIFISKSVKSEKMWTLKNRWESAEPRTKALWKRTCISAFAKVGETFGSELKITT